MSKELQVKDEEESVKLWLDEHAKKKIRGLVETFVEKTRNARKIREGSVVARWFYV